MNEDLIADIWIMIVEKLPEKAKDETAMEYVNLLLDHDIKESALANLEGIDPHLDTAIEYAIDGEEIESDDEYYDDDED
jgi:spermidine/putrescine-binding protein